MMALLFPRRCLGCTALSHAPFCLGCAQDVVPAPRLLFPGLDAFHGVYVYEGPVQRALVRLKQQGALYAGRALAHAAWRSLSEAPPALDAVVPIPSHPRHVLRRGYSASWEIARHLPVSFEPVLKRKLWVAPQRGKRRGVRKQQAKKSFWLKRPVDGRRVLLVDDVVTTGASMQEAAARVRQAGARWVGGLAVAVVL